MQLLKVIYVGRLTLDKGTHELVELAALLPNVRFELVGEILDDVKGLLSHPLPNIRIRGVLSHQKVIELLESSDIFIMPSHHEGFPMAVLEAMAVGLPIVSTPCGAVPEMISGDGGIIVPFGDVKAMKDAIELLRDNRCLADSFGKRNMQFCSTYYAYSKISKDLTLCYDEVLLK